MAQGKLKKSNVKVPQGAKRSKGVHKKTLGPKKGGRPIAPKKAKAIENQKMKKNFDKGMKAAIEKECTARAANNEAKSLHILKSEAGKDAKHAGKAEAKT